MKILLADSDHKSTARESIDMWRLIRPFSELKKHVDWQIDHVPFLIDEDLFQDGGKYPTDELAKQLEKLGEYDIIWTGYFSDAVMFDCMSFLRAKFGTRFVVDMDDDIYHLPKDNNFWNTAGWQGVKAIQWMIEQADYVVTSSPNLKAEFAKHRKAKPYLLPNFIGNDYKHPAFDNGDKVVISYFGSITHKRDIMETGFVEALAQIMHRYKNVYVKTVGMNIKSYLPVQRYEHHIGKSGKAWTKEIWPAINADITVAPLEDTIFNRCKTNIKWLESAMIPAACIASNIPPYKGSIKNGKTGVLTNNTSEDWYEALEVLVTNKALREKLATNAKAEVMDSWHIKAKWQLLREIIEDICQSD